MILKVLHACWKSLLRLNGKVPSVRHLVIWMLLVVGLIAGSGALRSEDSSASIDGGYLGFDRNDYPGDERLKVLRRTFSFSEYWLNNPPGASSNSGMGKRKVLQAAGFGFLVVFNGRTDAQIKLAGDATKLGSSD